MKMLQARKGNEKIFKDTYNRYCMMGECSGEMQGSYQTLTGKNGDQYLRLTAYVSSKRESNQKISTWVVGSPKGGNSEVLRCMWGEKSCEFSVMKTSIKDLFSKMNHTNDVVRGYRNPWITTQEITQEGNKQLVSAIRYFSQKTPVATWKVGEVKLMYSSFAEGPDAQSIGRTNMVVVRLSDNSSLENDVELGPITGYTRPDNSLFTMISNT